MRYTVTRNGNLVGSVTSLDKAISAAEQSFQCGVSQSKSEVKKALKLIGFAYVNHCLCDSLVIKIEAA